MKQQQLFTGLLSLCLCVGLAGCSGAAVQAADAPLGEVSIREAVTQAAPQDAVDAVYETLPDARVQPLDSDMFHLLFPTAIGLVDSYYGGVSDVNAGLADLIILAPNSGQRDEVRNALLSYQETRIREFEDYDILNSFEIAKSALVYSQGEYIILVMLPDNEEGQDIIDRHIPR